MGPAVLESISFSNTDKTSARFSRELTILSPGTPAALASSHCMYSPVSRRLPLTLPPYVAPVRSRVSILKLRRTHSSKIPSFHQSTIPSLESSTNRIKMNSSRARKLILTSFSSLELNASKVPLESTYSTSARARPFVIWYPLGMPSLGKENRSITGVSPTAP